MRKPGRPKNTIPSIDFKIHIPIPVAAKVDIFLLDPVTGKTRHGARSQLVTQLLINWLASKGVQPYLENPHAKAQADAAEKAAEAQQAAPATDALLSII